MDKVEGYRHDLNDAKEEFVHEQEKKCDLNTMVEQLTSNIEIGYNLAMDSFKKEVKKWTLMSNITRFWTF